MKKILSLLITITMLLTSSTAVHCEDDIRVLLDGNEIAFDVPPQIINDRVLVPMRAIFEALGAEVTWNGELQHIIAETQSKHIDMFIGNNVMGVTDSGEVFMKTITLDVPPQIIDDRTLVPVRAISESLDCGVEWDGDSRAVYITSAQAEVEPTPEATIEPSTIPIEYDDTTERSAHYARHFKLIDAVKTNEGYKITYSIKTFLEGRGTVGVTFDCYNADGNIVDTFGGLFIGTDYTWSEHEAEAVISDKTVKIKLRLEE